MSEARYKYKRIFRIVCVMLAAAMLLCGCRDRNGDGDDDPSDDPSTQYDLMADISPKPIPEKKADEAFEEAYLAFSSGVFSTVCKNNSGNTAVSPAALMQVLLIAANGSNGKTQNEILSAIAPLTSVRDLSSYSATFTTKLERDTKTRVTASTWINGADNVFRANNSFLQINSDYFLSDVYLVDIPQETSETHVSRWLSEKIGVSGFDGLAFLDSKSSVALVGGFSGEYSFASGFGGSERAEFDGENGTVETEFVSTTATSRIAIGYAVGFSIKLANGYTFAALLPQSGLTCDKIAAELTPKRIRECYLSAQTSLEFNVVMPEFSCSASPELSTELGALGIKALFDAENADISGFGTSKNKLSISSVYSPVSVSFNANGVSFSATAPEAPETTVDRNELATAEMRFDRPFVYILYDADGYPLVMGKVTDVAAIPPASGETE